MTYRVLVADPPWKFDDKLPGPGRGAEKHYRCMTAEELCALRMPALADDALLFLWRVASMQDEALQVAKAWGFKIKSELVWRKTTAKGAIRIGMGRYVRNAHETCLIGARGKASKLIEDHGVPSVFDATRVEHSAKPDEFYRIVDRLCEGPKVELFARRQWSDWTCLGDEAPEPVDLRQLSLLRGVEVSPVSASASEDCP